MQRFRGEMGIALGAQARQQGEGERAGMRVVVCFVDHHDAAVLRQLRDDLGGVVRPPLRGLWQLAVEGDAVVEREVADRFVVEAQFVLDRGQQLQRQDARVVLQARDGVDQVAVALQVVLQRLQLRIDIARLGGLVCRDCRRGESGGEQREAQHGSEPRQPVL